MKNEGRLDESKPKSDLQQEIIEFKAQFKPGPLAPRTNRGVRLNMTEEQVLEILGSPKRRMWSKKFGATELIYRRKEKWKSKEPADGTGMSWRNYYLFRKGRLFYIELAQDLEGGA